MSASCVGTCSSCGVRRFWLSDTLSLQMDDGQLICLPHPREDTYCEMQGLTLAQASQRRRLFRETFYVCRHCGRIGETIKRYEYREWDPTRISVRRSMIWCWGSALFIFPWLFWMQWWQTLCIVGSTLFITPGLQWQQNRKDDKEIAARGFPRADAPEQFAIAAPTSGIIKDTVVGHELSGEPGKHRATGACCDSPDWIGAFSAKNEDRIPCYACGQGVMLISEQSIH